MKYKEKVKRGSFVSKRRKKETKKKQNKKNLNTRDGALGFLRKTYLFIYTNQPSA